MWLMAYVSLSENCRHLSSIFLWQPKFDEHCAIVNRNICHLAIAPKLLSLVLMCLDIFLVLPKLDSGLEMCLWLLRKAHVELLLGRDVELGVQRFELSTARLTGNDGMVTVKPEAGAPMGDPFAVAISPKVFILRLLAGSWSKDSAS